MFLPLTCLDTYWDATPEQTTDLFVHQNVDNGIEQCWGLWKKSRDGHGCGWEGSAPVHENPCSKRCIWDPSKKEAKNHQDAHTCYFPLSFLGWSGVLLLGCGLGIGNSTTVNVRVLYLWIIKVLTLLLKKVKKKNFMQMQHSTVQKQHLNWWAQNQQGWKF